MYSTRDWTCLPLLPAIANRLGLVELLRFRAVCRDWFAATSAASAEIESLPDNEPWFLFYDDDNSPCTLVTEYFSEKYTIDVPELKGTKCLASCEGWLLLSCNEGSMFFFCPLSRARIDIPVTFPNADFSNHVAILSAPPTSDDCVVGVISRTETEIKLHSIRRGDNSWTEYKLYSIYPRRIRYAAYYKKGFYFFDTGGLMVYFSIKEPALRLAEVQYVKPQSKEEGVTFRYNKEEEKNQMVELKEQLALEDMSQVSICGTTVPCDNARSNKMVPYVNNRVSNKQGAWFQPRFHQISGNRSW